MTAEYRSLVSLLERQREIADASESELSYQREQNHIYYALGPLGNEQKGRSHYVSPDVHDTVESKKAYFTEVFFTGREPLRFKSQGEGRQLEADARTAYVNIQLRKNRWFELARDGWHDAFVAKRMVVLAEWVDDEMTVVQSVEGASVLDIQNITQGERDLLSIDPARLQQAGQNQAGMPVFKGELVLIKDNSQVQLTLLQPEMYFRDPDCAYVRDATFAGFSRDVSRSELVRDGFDPEQIKSLRSESRVPKSEEDNARRYHDSTWTRQKGMGLNQESEKITVYRTWTWIDLDAALNDGDPDLSKTKLYEIHWAGGEILKKAPTEEYPEGALCIYERDEMPFFEWTEYKVSHAEHGIAVSDVVRHTQKTNSTLKRLVIDNQQMRNTSRYEAVAGAIKNPRDLLNNQIGGVIWTRMTGSVKPLDAPELSPLTLPVIELMDRDREARSGVSRLAQGLSTDALRYQNAADMVERLTNNANRRILRACRDFAESFLGPLAQYIYRLGARNDRRVYQVEIRGAWFNLEPSQWVDADFPIEVHKALTPDEGLKHGQALLTAHQILSADPQLQLAYGPAQRHALLDDMLEAFGISDSSRYLLRPGTPEYQQAAQAAQQQMQQQQAQQQQLMQAQFQLAQSDDKRKWFDSRLKGMDLQHRVVDRMEDNARQDKELRHQMKVDEEELAIERKQRRAAKVG